MAKSGKLALGSKGQAILLAVLAAILILAVVRWRSGGSEAPAPAGAGVPRRAAAGPSGPEDDAAPARTLHRAPASTKAVSIEDVLLIDPRDFDPPSSRGTADGGRDLFGLREPTARPQPTATPRAPLPCEAAYVGPCGPPTPTPAPRPPEIAFKFVGSFGPKDRPIAVIQQGDEIFNARAGDTLFGKFVLRKVGYESIDVGFVGFGPTETRRLGITP